MVNRRWILLLVCALGACQSPDPGRTNYVIDKGNVKARSNPATGSLNTRSRHQQERRDRQLDLYGRHPDRAHRDRQGRKRRSPGGSTTSAASWPASDRPAATASRTSGHSSGPTVPSNASKPTRIGTAASTSGKPSKRRRRRAADHPRAVSMDPDSSGRRPGDCSTARTAVSNNEKSSATSLLSISISSRTMSSWQGE